MNNVPEKHRAVAHKWVDGAAIEWRAPETDDWQGATRPAWDYFCEYRVALTKPSINWDHVDKDLNYLAIDEDGTAYLYETKPDEHLNYFKCSTSDCVEATGFASFKPGTCNWVDSLIVRPGHDEESK